MSTQQRTLRPGMAFLAGIAGAGYLYTGRLSLAIGILVASYANVAIVAWTRGVLEPTAAYAGVLVGGVLAAVGILHPVVIASRQRVAPTHPYNRPWVYAAWIVGSLALAFGVSRYRAELLGFASYRIPSPAMAPTLARGDFIVMDAWRYHRFEPAAGDVAVVERDGVLNVKRIVGVPGDRVAITGGQLFVNDSPVEEPYLSTRPETLRYRTDMPPVELAELEYYVLGDNRDNSLDSRQWGPVDRNALRGRVEYIGFHYGDSGIDADRFPLTIAEAGRGSGASACADCPPTGRGSGTGGVTAASGGRADALVVQLTEAATRAAAGTGIRVVSGDSGFQPGGGGDGSCAALSSGGRIVTLGSIEAAAAQTVEWAASAGYESLMFDGASENASSITVSARGYRCDATSE